MTKGTCGIEVSRPFGTGNLCAFVNPTLKGWAILISPFGRPQPDVANSNAFPGIDALPGVERIV